MTRDNDTLVREFVEAFNTKDSDQLAPYLHPDVVFHAYGDSEVLAGTRSSPCGRASSQVSSRFSSRPFTRRSTVTS
jgi:hypothetical protein